MVGKDGSCLCSSLQRGGQKGLKSFCLEEVTSYSAIPFFQHDWKSLNLLISGLKEGTKTNQISNGAFLTRTLARFYDTASPPLWYQGIYSPVVIILSR